MAKPPIVRRRATGIPGMDDMIMGGLPSPSSVLVAGEPGTGKTTLSVQSLFYGARMNEKGLYITAISEPQWVVQKFLSTFKFYDQRLVDKGGVSFVDIGRELVTNPSGILETITTTLERYMPERVAIDPITPIRDILHWRGETREFMHELFARLKAFDCTSLVTAEMTYDDLPQSIEGYMADGVIMLSYPEEERVRRKFLEVVKMRGTKHTTGRQLLEISQEGLAVQPGLR
ncbi:MAG: ATPase domain-containing protein [Candidatus Thermoplasmatota archaeon]